MGVLNLTPDSFSDGGRFTVDSGVNLSAVVDAAAEMVAEGVDWLDLGGESTRPGAEPVSEQQELDRVIPALESLARRFETPISIDTSNPKVISESAHLGAKMINDVRALQRPGAMETFAKTDLDVCLMHMQGDPASMQKSPSYESVSSQVIEFLKNRLDDMKGLGIAENRICLDPGFGFGKSLEHNLELLRSLPKIGALGRPILVGLSRKSMIGMITGRAVQERLAGTIGLNMLALQNGASILRVHDVAEALDTIKIWQSFRMAD